MRGAYMRSNTSVKKNVGLSAGEPTREGGWGGGGAYRRRNTIPYGHLTYLCLSVLTLNTDNVFRQLYPVTFLALLSSG